MIKRGRRILLIIISIILIAGILLLLLVDIGWFTGKAISGNIGLTILGADLQQFDLLKGWNFISFDVQLSDYDIQTALTPIDGYYDYIQEWDSTTQDFKVWSKLGQKDFTTFNVNKSYFIYVNQNIHFNRTGRFFHNWTITLLPGWETPDYVLIDSSNVSGNSFKGIAFDYMQKWNASNQDFLVYSPLSASNSFDRINQGEGYFIRTNGGDIVYIQ